MWMNNEKWRDGHTPLVSTVRAGHLTVVMILAECGAPLDMGTGHLDDMLGKLETGMWIENNKTQMI